MSTIIQYDKVTQAEKAIIRDIAERAHQMARKSGLTARESNTLMEWQMDITAVHANVQRLRLTELLAADDFNFAHDVFGIMRHLNRETITLSGFFSPRFSEREVQP